MGVAYPIYASDLTFWKCPRALYYNSTARDKRSPLDDETKIRLNHYARLETMAIAKLQESGWNIVSPKSFKPGVIVPKDEQELYTYQIDGADVIRGRIDLIACPPGKEVGGLFEIKTVNESIFNKTDHITDLIEMPIWWSGQVAQWLAYMYMSGRDYGGIIQFCRESGNIKIHYGSILKGNEYYDERLDEFCHTVIGNVETAWTGAVTGIEPDFCSDLAICANCWCRGVTCSPPMVNPGINTGFIGHNTREQVTRMIELKPLRDEYEKIKKQVEEPIKVSVQDHGASPEGYIIGEGGFIARAVVKGHTSYRVPEEIRNQYKHVGIAVSISIEPI